MAPCYLVEMCAAPPRKDVKKFSDLNSGVKMGFPMWSTSSDTIRVLLQSSAILYLTFMDNWVLASIPSLWVLLNTQLETDEKDSIRHIL